MTGDRLRGGGAGDIGTSGSQRSYLWACPLRGLHTEGRYLWVRPACAQVCVVGNKARALGQGHRAVLSGG